MFSVEVDAGDGYSSWLEGTYELEEEGGNFGDLTLTATWEEGENSTTLADATSGTPKTYALENGIYTIGVNIPSAGVKNFKLDPINDKVGEAGDNGENGSDVSSTDQITQTSDTSDTDPAGEEEKTAMVTLEGTDAGTHMTAKLAIYDDNTFDFLLSDAVVFGGTWALDETDQTKINLSPDEIGAPVIGQTVVVTAAIAEGGLSYACRIIYTVTDPVAITMTFDMTGFVATEVPEKTTMLEMTADNGSQKGKLDLYTDNSWNLAICYFGDDYVDTASGTYALNGYTKIDLTVTSDVGNMLPSDTYEVAIEAGTTISYSVSITINIPGMGESPLDFVGTMPIPTV